MLELLLGMQSLIRPFVLPVRTLSPVHSARLHTVARSLSSVRSHTVARSYRHYTRYRYHYPLSPGKPCQKLGSEKRQLLMIIDVWRAACFTTRLIVARGPTMLQARNP